MRDRNRWMIQGATSGLVFATFAVIAGFLVEWPGSDILSAGIIAFCGGAALEHFMRRHYGVAWIFIVAGVGMGFFMIHAETALKATVEDAASAVGSGTNGPRSAGAGEAGAPGRSTRKPSNEDKRRAPADEESKPAPRTTVQVHNPNAFPVSVAYEYAGGTLQLGSLAGEATDTFDIPSTAAIELGAFVATVGDRTARTRILLRRGQTHQIDLPFLGDR